MISRVFEALRAPSSTRDKPLRDRGRGRERKIRASFKAFDETSAHILQLVNPQRSENMEEAEQKFITAESGQNVTLACLVPTTSTIRVVKWSRADRGNQYVLLYQDGLFVPDDQDPSFKNRVELRDRQMKDGDVSVILKNVTINDAGTYECRVFTEETRTLKLIINITLRVVAPPPAVIPAQPQLSGQNVTLTGRAPNSNTIRVVKWSRADQGDQYLLLYRDGQFDPDNQHPSFKNRVDLKNRQMKDGDVSVILKNVMINDTGTYECHVAKKQERYDLHIRRQVMVAEQKIITAESGQNVTLTGRAPNSNTIRVVKWSRADQGDQYLLLYRDGQFDPDNQHPSFKNRVDLKNRQMKDGDVSVILKNVMINDTGTYECHVVTEETHSPKLIESITLRVVAPPDQKTITAESGQNVTLTCRAPNNNIIVAEWRRRDLKGQYVLMYRDEQLDPEHQHPSFKNRVDLQDREMKDGDVSVILRNVTTADNGTYECRVVHGVRQPMRLISIIYLRVVPPPGSAGLIVGLIVAALLLLGAALFIHRRWKQQQSVRGCLPDAQQQLQSDSSL
ncbi:polymeric immunoglobulin receptor-like [Archocentrus centrarchus]|uniref:polymeric immunoglobulin receptor-like n=1 Tax=Archocentrus centrarchus TaxID=63155 RepID=UPI0011E9B5AE|nr:polymeric immunoglobulin receptor-like [Archocentrus centrarchus]